MAAWTQVMQSHSQDRRRGKRRRDSSARGVAQDVPFFTAARLERRTGALTGTGGCDYFGLMETKSPVALTILRS
jgi:hypothetical protein